MSFFEFNKVRIAGMSAAVPARNTRNDNSNVVSNKYDWAAFVESTGVYQRRTSDTLTTSDLCYGATRKLLDDLGWSKSDVEALIFVSLSPDYMQPATAGILQDRLGMSKECFAEDILLGCSGWVYGLCNAVSLVSSGNIKKALLLAGDAKFRAVHPLDPLFGFAGTVTALEYCDDSEPIRFHLGTDGSGYDALIIPDGGARNQLSAKSFELENIDGKMMHRVQGRMKGMDVFSFGITTVPKSLKKLSVKYDIDLASFDYYVLHQANKKMNDAIIKKLGLEESKVPSSMYDFGNTSSASIPLTIVTQLRNISQSKSFLCCGFGIGLSWGSVAFHTDKDFIVSNLIEMDEWEYDCEHSV